MDFNICPGAGIVDLSAKYLFSHKPERIRALPHWKNTRSTWMRKTERGSADGMDVSPRGDEPGFIHIEDDHTLLLPDRRGNNRIDSMRNLLINPAIALLVLVPGINETLRINGHAEILIDEETLARFKYNNTL